MTGTTASRIRGALWGLFIGDALAMPVHWYYDREALRRDYGRVTGYLPPKTPHPDSILWRSNYQAPNARGEILHDQAAYWGRKGIHYHQFLQAGENTLNVDLCSMLIRSLVENGRYAPEDFLERYIGFMTTPGSHRDTYIEECHRNFFGNLARGYPPEKCGREEKHIGGLIGVIPVAAFFHDDPARARQDALRHLALTHPGAAMATAATLVIDLLLAVLNGTPLQRAVTEAVRRQDNPFLGHPFTKWLTQPDDHVIGRRLSTACYVDHAIPAVIYLALKYHDNPEEALIVNTNLGGDNAGRGAVLGALLGAENGLEGFPRPWVDGLLNPPPDLIPR